MRHAHPLSQDLSAAVPGAAWLAFGLLVAASAWLAVHLGVAAGPADDARRVEFMHATAGIQGRIHLMRELEKNLLASSSSARKSGYYRQRREEARRRIDELARGAAAVADGGEEHLRLAQLAALVRVADSRYGRRWPASAARAVAMQTSEVTFVQP